MDENAGGTFHLVLIKPSHYDDEGYVIQWAYSWLPSNTLATLYGLASDAAERQVLGAGVEIRITALDETNTRVRVEQIAALIDAPGTRGLVGLVGVQSNQYPRALDLARKFRAHGVQVCIGGFHVSGSLAMLDETPPELQAALDIGVTLFAGEAEGRLDQLLRDAWSGTLAPIYDHLDDLPALENAPVPHLPATTIRRAVGARTSFDAGRGCPFMCSFCTIINVQGRKSRHRSADDVERIVRANAAQGISSFFITDDNFARNTNWEPIFDRIIDLRVREGMRIKLIIQVDTMCHKVPRFVEKAGRAGVGRVFIGLENINPESLQGARKGQNRITEYRTMLQAWHAVGATTYAGYIVGFPGDTPESLARDVRIIQRELPIDLLEFFVLTPLPGSADHRKLHREGVAMDPDMNNYDTSHVTTAHPVMSTEQWLAAYWDAWDVYYTPEHVVTLLRRAKACGVNPYRVAAKLILFSASVRLERLHPLEGGFWRRRDRHDRRAGYGTERLVSFHLHKLSNVLKFLRLFGMLAGAAWSATRVALDPRPYTDLTFAEPEDADLDSLALFQSTRGGQAAVERTRRRQHRATSPARA